jgi:HDOD domain
MDSAKTSQSHRGHQYQDKFCFSRTESAFGVKPTAQVADNCAGDRIVFTKTFFPSRPGRNPVVELRRLHAGLVNDLPDIPVLPETLLRLHLETQELSVDLRAISLLVLGDLGAALQIFRLAGREYGNVEDRPTRIEDCISALGLDACLEAVSAQTQPRHYLQDAIAETWAHAREIAQYSKLVAEEMPEVSPEEAYLVGLLHGIGSLPTLLGRFEGQAGVSDLEMAGLKLAKQWCLPQCIVQFFSERCTTGCTTAWQEIVRRAHHRALRSSILCTFEQEMRPRLKRSS